MGLVGVAVLLACAGAREPEEDAVQHTPSNAFDFVIGDWDIAMTVVPEGAAIGRRATMRAYRFLDGTAIIDEWRHLDPAGAQVVFRGAGFRTFLPEDGQWYVLWMMAGVEGYSELRAEVVQNEIHTAGRGRDPGGELIERGRYFNISRDEFFFSLDRSYDGGGTWIRPFVAFHATRR